MTADPKLVEAVARAIALREDGEDTYWQHYAEAAADALAAINASGEWWVAPVELPADVLYECGSIPNPEYGRIVTLGSHLKALFAAMRTAYLAKPEEK